ncbi:hypothetical protein ACIQ4I_07930 [Rummeliibacillus sp. NPDC094406]|uniref:hypothetical protein n=1 Tax=Rummeliibacillus sp. NPDC094406 TaxID=3364511 RepID=UPI0037F61DEE
MIKKLVTVVLVCFISFLAGSYYTMNNPSTPLNDWNKTSVELFASTPATLNSAFEDLKIVLTTSMDFIDSKIDNLLAHPKDVSDNIEKNQPKQGNPLEKPADDLQKIDVDHEEKDIMPARGGIEI